MRSKHALIFYLKDSLGGAERRLTRIYNAMCSDDKELICDLVIRGCDRSTALGLFKQADCDVTCIHKIIAFKSTFMCFFYLFFKFSYRTIHFFDTGNFNLAVEKLCRIMRKKSIFSICSYREGCNIGLTDEHRLNVLKQLKNADYVDLLNPSGQDFVKNYSRGTVYTTPGTFTNLDIFFPSPKEKIILYAPARLEKAKNPLLLVEAVELCQKEIRNNGYLVKILGKGELENKIKSIILKDRLDDIIEMHGYTQTSSFMPIASVFLSLQSIENYPSQSVAEAVASGCYLIITDVGDSRKCADNSFASFIKDDPKELADSIIKYIYMTELEKEEIVLNARCFAEKKYNITSSKNYFRKILCEATEG